MDEQTERIRRINHRGANTSNYNFFGFDLLHSALKLKKVQFVALFASINVFRIFFECSSCSSERAWEGVMKMFLKQLILAYEVILHYLYAHFLLHYFSNFRALWSWLSYLCYQTHCCSQNFLWFFSYKRRERCQCISIEKFQITLLQIVEVRHKLSRSRILLLIYTRSSNSSYDLHSS